jgi:hypothetical protein
VTETASSADRTEDQRRAEAGLEASTMALYVSVVLLAALVAIRYRA